MDNKKSVQAGEDRDPAAAGTDDTPFVAVTKRTTLRVGDRVEVSVDEPNLQLVDKETGGNVSAPLDDE